MNAKELEQIIENHEHWLYEEVEGWEDMCANLRNANLSNANMRFADLRFTDLRNADLRFTDLRNADLRFTDLRNANMRFADLRFTDLRNADLSGADMRGADLRGADLRFTNLIGANLSDAILCDANLRGANMRDVNLNDANLWCANLRYADLRGAKNVPYIPMICPEEGEFIGYKKASDKIVKLLIPKDAKRSSATTRKCRCNKAIVLTIYELDGSISKVTEVVSNRDPNFIYKINKEVVVDNFDDDRWNECSTGIHFFMQKQEAINYTI